MSISLHIRDVPNDLHRTLVARAEGRGMSLRRYVLEVLADHTILPTLEEWLDDLAGTSPVTLQASVAEAVRLSREEDDEEVLSALSRG